MSDKSPFEHLPRRSMFVDSPRPTASETKPVATNKPNTVATNTKSANRRDKSAFNTYQRDYMRKRRAAKKASAS